MFDPDYNFEFLEHAIEKCGSNDLMLSTPAQRRQLAWNYYSTLIAAAITSKCNYISLERQLDHTITAQAFTSELIVRTLALPFSRTFWNSCTRPGKYGFVVLGNAKHEKIVCDISIGKSSQLWEWNLGRVRQGTFLRLCQHLQALLQTLLTA